MDIQTFRAITVFSVIALIAVLKVAEVASRPPASARIGKIATSVRNWLVRSIAFVRARLVVITATAVALWFGIYVWPTRFHYSHVNYSGTSFIVRIDRIHGTVEYLGPLSGTWHSRPHR